MEAENWQKRASLARRAAHAALSGHEAAASRVILLEDLLKKLAAAPIDVQDYFNEAVSCLEQGLNRSGIVLAWAGHFYVFSDALYAKHEHAVRSSRPKWVFKDLSDLKEQFAESQILDAAREVKFIGRADLRLLQGQLAQRNQCAHPTLYRPSTNVAIGYVDEMIHQTLRWLEP